MAEPFYLKPGVQFGEGGLDDTSLSYHFHPKQPQSNEPSVISNEDIPVVTDIWIGFPKPDNLPCPSIYRIVVRELKFHISGAT